MLIDSHCHILKEEYDNPNEVINRSLNNGISKIIINGYDLKTSKESIILANSYKNVYCAIGIAPSDVDKMGENDIKEIEELIKNKKVVAIGEIGLDYYWTKENKEKQIFVFQKMLELAKKYKLPVIVHNREATKDTYNILREYGVNGIIHCFSGSLETAKEFIKIGFLIGVGGVVTFKNSKNIKEVVKNIDLSYISLETDSPYLSPEPKRGTINEPLNIKYIAQKVSQIKDAALSDVMDITSSNVIALFDLKD